MSIGLSSWQKTRHPHQATVNEKSSWYASRRRVDRCRGETNKENPTNASRKVLRDTQSLRLFRRTTRADWNGGSEDAPLSWTVAIIYVLCRRRVNLQKSHAPRLLYCSNLAGSCM
mmetsp:Transcript_3931/g.5405  ORF Transcript_3931/g.5405 Transcript_3931/m.5405 type:complete len:115 (+) Transcript_3931:304-648(+)